MIPSSEQSAESSKIGVRFRQSRVQNPVRLEYDMEQENLYELVNRYHIGTDLSFAEAMFFGLQPVIFISVSSLLQNSGMEFSSMPL